MASEKQKRRLVGVMYRPMCKILILIGIATILLALVTVWQYRSSTTRTATTTGNITAVNKVSGIGRDEEGHNGQKCRINYRVSVAGHNYTDALGYRGDPTTAKCKLQVGQPIAINYDPHHPANNAYQVDEELSDHQTFQQTVSSTAGIAIVGLISLFIGIFGLHVANDEYSRAHEAAVRVRNVAGQTKEKAKAKAAKVVKRKSNDNNKD